MNSNKHLLSLTAAALCAAAVVPAAASADYERGTYDGKTKQAAVGDAKPYAGSFKIALGILSDPPRVTRVELGAQLACDDGTTRDVRYGKVIAFGPKLNRKGRFSHTDGGLVMKGTFNKKGKASGTFSYTVENCTIVGATWTAKD